MDRSSFSGLLTRVEVADFTVKEYEGLFQTSRRVGGATRPKSEKPRKSREGNRSKRLKGQQQERKEKYCKRQCRTNHEQHHQLSKLNAPHDV
jgi:hypothetical protein